MPSFDIVSRMNFAELNNALNNTRKAIAARFDFRGVTAELTLDEKEKKLKIVTDDGTKMNGIREMFESAAHKRGLALKSFVWGEPEPALAGKLKREVKIQDGIEQEKAKGIVKIVKDSKMKVQASIQGDELRVNGKQIDDLQAVMRLLDGAGLDVPLQYVNLKS
ncbi:MAG TPA: YajQ family cyclic di-GMP-binding protein [Phycisphaerales bacterium]|nr:YajQ family cyclic di-GMP-binding protein [Phycisphaerales bacterium]